jgi:Ca2+-binding RTX toxin-like protein
MKRRLSNRLSFESLERREMMAADAFLKGNLLLVQGTDSSDTIVVSQTKTAITVQIQDSATNATRLQRTFSASSVTSIDVKGLAGNDSIYNHTSKPSKMFGGSGGDTIYGSDSASDTLYSGTQAGGADTGTNYLYGRGGADTLRGGSARDIIQGGNQNDTIYGAGDNDELWGGDHDDWIYGEAGFDVAHGESGNDHLFGGIGDDVLFGEAAIDELFGEADNDTLVGGAGADYLDAGIGKDRLYGFDNFCHASYDGETDTYRDSFNLNQWVADGVSSLDVNQDKSHTCSILATLAAVAEASAVDLAGGIRYLGNSQFEVRLFPENGGPAVWQRIQFDGSWTTTDAQPTRERLAAGEAALLPVGVFDSGTGASEGLPLGAVVNEFWPLLYQRAYLEYMGVNWREPNPNNWVEQAPGHPVWARSWLVAEVITGWQNSTQTYFGDLSGATQAEKGTVLRQSMITALSSGHVLTFGGLGHVYAVLGIDNAAGKITLYDPRAADNNTTRALDRDRNNNPNDGRIVMSWDAFLNNYITNDDGEYVMYFSVTRP